MRCTMPYCPACGHHVAPGDDACSECGRSIAAALAGGRRDPGPADESGRARERARSDGADTRQSVAPAGDDSTTRRRVLASAGGVLGTMVLGGYAVERLADGPVDAVDAWRTAWVTGDAATFRRLWHSAATQPETWPDDALDRPSGPDPALQYIGEDRTLLEETGARATVREVFVLGHPDFETRRRHETVVDLRTEAGDWRVFEERLERSEPVTGCRRTITINGPGRLVCE